MLVCKIVPDEEKTPGDEHEKYHRVHILSFGEEYLRGNRQELTEEYHQKRYDLHKEKKKENKEIDKTQKNSRNKNEGVFSTRVKYLPLGRDIRNIEA